MSLARGFKWTIGLALLSVFLLGCSETSDPDWSHQFEKRELDKTVIHFLNFKHPKKLGGKHTLEFYLRCRVPDASHRLDVVGFIGQQDGDRMAFDNPPRYSFDGAPPKVGINPSDLFGKFAEIFLTEEDTEVFFNERVASFYQADDFAAYLSVTQKNLEKATDAAAKTNSAAGAVGGLLGGIALIALPTVIESARTAAGDLDALSRAKNAKFEYAIRGQRHLFEFDPSKKIVSDFLRICAER